LCKLGLPLFSNVEVYDESIQMWALRESIGLALAPNSGVNHVIGEDITSKQEFVFVAEIIKKFLKRPGNLMTSTTSPEPASHMPLSRRSCPFGSAES
jgi:hypothetical protein